MAVRNFDVLNIDGEKNNFAYQAAQTLSSAGNGDWFLVPAGVDYITAILSITTGTGKIQVSNATIAELEADTASAIEWTPGEVSVTTQSLILPVVAIRVVNTTGTVKMELKAS